jgi:hypothetical protein
MYRAIYRPSRTVPYVMLSLSILAGAPLAAQLSSAETQTIQQETTSPVPYSSWVVTETFTGTMKDVGGFISTFTSDFTAQGLDSALGSFRPVSVVVLPQDPDSVTLVTMQVGLTVPKQLAVRPPLRIQQIQFPRTATHTHTGSYQDLGLVHAAMAKALPTSQHLGWPVVLLLLNDPTLVDPSAIQTTMVVQELPN